MDTNDCTRRSSHLPQPPLYLLFTSMISLRIQRRWQQSGQKHAGAPDIASSLQGYYSPLLWLLVLGTLLDLAGEISLRTLGRAGMSKRVARGAAVVLTATAFVFKLCFTANDQPELLSGIMGFEALGGLSFCQRLDLIWAARAVFFGILASAMYVVTQRGKLS